jgi:hypothetical protein
MVVELILLMLKLNSESVLLAFRTSPGHQVITLLLVLLLRMLLLRMLLLRVIVTVVDLLLQLCDRRVNDFLTNLLLILRPHHH